MFKELGQMMGLMKNLPKLQAAMQDMQFRLGQITVEGNAGAGMVVVTANGRMEVTKCLISEDALKLNDRDMLADLVMAAVNMAMSKAREEVAKASQAVAQEAGLPLPPGLIPGM
ncbi:MAG TPA: YbaB/EbfC family nucleoid-associated protein [Gemmataceae bacterium]|nr:YbaB/EbfC family nucleoid-associated protein [Gemmataceae bacterium]